MKYQPLFLLILVITNYSCGKNKEHIKLELTKGKEYYYSNKYDSAIVHLNKAINIDSSNAEAFYFLSKVYFSSDNYQEAMRQIELAKKNKFNIDSTNFWKSKIFLAQEKYDDCIKLCDTLLSRNGSDYKVHLTRGTALYNKAAQAETTEEQITLNKEALKNANQALNIHKGDNQIYALRGVIRYGLEDYKGAIKDFDLVIGDEKKDSVVISKVYRFKGLSHKSMGNYQIAENLLDSAIIFNNTSGLNYFNRGYIRLKLKETDDACDDFSKALELGMDDAVYFIRNNCK